MATPNQITESENAAHSPGVPVDPFAVDFFGAPKPLSDDDESFAEQETIYRRRVKPRKRSDWHKNLPKITNAEAEFSSLLSNLPENLTERAAKIICETLARFTFQPSENANCSIVAVAETNLSEAIRKLNDSPKVFLSIGTQSENSAIVALNVDLACALIDSILDGQSAQIGHRRDLSPVETTIAEFLAVNIVSEINNFLGESMLVLQSVGHQPAFNFEPSERGAEILLNLETGGFGGVINIFAPPRFLRFLDKAQNALFGRNAERKTLKAFEKIAPALDLRLQIGTTYLDADSLLYLEREDIVLIEQSQADLMTGNFGGNLQLFVGRGANVRLRGAAEPGDLNGKLNFRIEDILSEEARRRFTPAKFKMDEKENDLTPEAAFEGDAPAGDEPEEEMPDEQIAPSLENVQVALRVEIAGDKISLRELQNLRAGQIIALGVSPADPVRLVTDNNDEPVATGELVEIEGQLGVRLTKVFI